MQMHGTAIARDQTSVILTGDSGSGKSDLALRLLDRGWTLVGDDQLQLSHKEDHLFVAGDSRLRDTLEVRGLGLVSVPTAETPVRVSLLVKLQPTIPRLPIAETCTLLGCEIPVVRLNAFEISAPNKLEWAHRAPDIIGRTDLGDTGK